MGGGFSALECCEGGKPFQDFSSLACRRAVRDVMVIGDLEKIPGCPKLPPADVSTKRDGEKKGSNGVPLRFIKLVEIVLPVGTRRGKFDVGENFIRNAMDAVPGGNTQWRRSAWEQGGGAQDAHNECRVICRCEQIIGPLGAFQFL